MFIYRIMHENINERMRADKYFFISTSIEDKEAAKVTEQWSMYAIPFSGKQKFKTKHSTGDYCYHSLQTSFASSTSHPY